MVALAMYVRADRLGYPCGEYVSVVTVKCDPMLIDTLIQRSGYHRAYHMNKTQWLTIELESGVSDEEIRSLVDLSYRLTDKSKSLILINMGNQSMFATSSLMSASFSITFIS